MGQSFSIQFLGTGTSQGIPVIGCECDVCKSVNPKNRRLRTSAIIHTPRLTILIDAGPDLRQQLLGLSDLPEALLITHAHQDHIAGMDDLRPVIFLQGNDSFPVFCNQTTADRVRQMYPYAFVENPYPGAPKFALNIISQSVFHVKDELVIPIFGSHAGMEVLGFRVGPIVYITDMNCISDDELEKAKGAEIMVINALRKEKHHSHFNVDEAIDIGRKSGVPQVYFTHISHHLDHDICLPPGFFMAYDGLKISV
ncbi:MAG: MBL fold metallo-hydrolase [Flavobacteriales bacterium]|nr:MAG: MBL fold metallo-hydrolase [Flavobacteriales bacterium]